VVWSVFFFYQHACCLFIVSISYIHISQSGVATPSWCGNRKIFSNHFVANFSQRLSVWEFYKSVKVKTSTMQCGTFLRHSVVWRRASSGADVRQTATVAAVCARPVIYQSTFLLSYRVCPCVSFVWRNVHVRWSCKLGYLEFYYTNN